MLTARYTVIRHDTGKVETVVDYTQVSVLGSEGASKTLDLSAQPSVQKPDFTDEDIKTAIAAVANVSVSDVTIAEPPKVEAVVSEGIAGIAEAMVEA